MTYYIAAAIVCQWNPNCKRLLITNYNQLEDRLCSMLANKEPLVALGALVRRDNPQSITPLYWSVYPQKRDEFDTLDYSDTTLVEGIETVYPRFAISWRNKCMIKQSNYVVAYVTPLEAS